MGEGDTEILTSSPVTVTGGSQSADKLVSRKNPRGEGDRALESSAGADTPGEDSPISSPIQASTEQVSTGFAGFVPTPAIGI